jgi:hypothetical protein
MFPHAGKSWKDIRYGGSEEELIFNFFRVVIQRIVDWGAVGKI